MKKCDLDSCIKILENIRPEAGDPMENAAVCLLDLNDMLQAKGFKEFKRQRKDCLRTMKYFYKTIKKIKFKR
jgi:hypothetical protein